MDKKDYGRTIKTARWRRRLNEERKECSADYDGLKYVNLCDTLCLKPENPVLYEHGLTELMILKNKVKFF